MGHRSSRSREVWKGRGLRLLLDFKLTWCEYPFFYHYTREKVRFKVMDERLQI